MPTLSFHTIEHLTELTTEPNATLVKLIRFFFKILSNKPSILHISDNTLLNMDYSLQQQRIQCLSKTNIKVNNANSFELIMFSTKYWGFFKEIMRFN